MWIRNSLKVGTKHKGQAKAKLVTVQLLGLSLGLSSQDLVNLEFQKFQAHLNSCLDQVLANQDQKL